MQLTQEDRELVAEWLRDKCGQMRCFCCGEGAWELLPQPGITIGFNVRTTRFHYHQGVPQVWVACHNCGHLVTFSAHMIGLRPDLPDGETVEDAGEPSPASDA